MHGGAPCGGSGKAAQLCAEQSRSITTFRFVPTDLALGDNKTVSYLDQLNLELLTRLQASGETYLSNAVVHGKFALRACIVNFRTSLTDIEALPPHHCQDG